MFNTPLIGNQGCQFFAKLVPAVDRFLVKCILPEIIGRWYTRQSLAALDASAIPTGSGGELDVTSGNDLTDTTKEVYCICKGIDDGRRMVMCENDDCKSGTWFHFECTYEFSQKASGGNGTAQTAKPVNELVAIAFC